MGSVMLDRMRIEHSQVGQGYGYGTDAAEGAIDLCAQHGGPTLETIYTGKTFAALVAEAARRPGERFLFWNTFNQLSFDDLVQRTPFEELPATYRRALSLPNSPASTGPS